MPEVTERAQAAAGEAQAQGREVASHAADQAQQVGQTAKAQAGAVLDEAKQRSREVASNARRELESQGDAQAERASGALRDLSKQLQAMVDGTSESGLAMDLAREAAQRADGIATRLDDGGVSGVVDDVQRFARRRPGLFLLGAGLAGLAAGRILRNADLQQIKQSATGGSDGSSSPGSGQPGVSAGSPVGTLPATPVLGGPAPIAPLGRP